MFTRAVTKTLAASLAAAAATLALTPSAHAAEPRSVVVSYADLNLASDDGAKALETRIEHAARRVCATANRMTLTERQAVFACQDAAATNAQQPMTQAIALARDGRRHASAAGVSVTAAR